MRESRGAGGARVSAAIAVLDRGWGKPSQAVEMEVRQDPPKKLSDEELDETMIAVQDFIKGSKGDGLTLAVGSATFAPQIETQPLPMCEL